MRPFEKEENRMIGDEWPNRWWEPGCEDAPKELPEEQWLPDDKELPFE